MINTICVCGAGTMGSGIAQTAAQSGLDVILYEVNGPALEKAVASIQKNLDLLIAKGKMMPEDKATVMNRIRFTNSIADCHADIFIEAIVEQAGPKINLFNELQKLNPGLCIFASNTSSLSLTQIAAGLTDPSRLLGMHFFNPAPLMKLVEVVKTDHTDQDALKSVADLARRMKKTPVICKDSPGFIVNRIARPYYIESLRLIEEGIADIGQVDRVLEGVGFKMGPFRLMDLIGNDINYAVSCSIYDQLERPERLKPSFIQKEKIDKGELGKKTGTGYYSY